MHLSEGRVLGNKHMQLHSCLCTHIHIYCTIVSRATDYKPRPCSYNFYLPIEGKVKSIAFREILFPWYFIKFNFG